MLKYTHPSVPKDRRIVVNDVYDLEFLKTIYTMERIKIFFSPVDFEWDELEVKVKVKSEVKDKNIVLEKEEVVEIKKSDNTKTQYNNYPFNKKQ